MNFNSCHHSFCNYREKIVKHSRNQIKARRNNRASGEEIVTKLDQITLFLINLCCFSDLMTRFHCGIDAIQRSDLT
ncbi:unnamed protein product [Thlaspi arvense]|uniref:Uncharacterized protein n=1 Tax=Thlaspi arvense TaxID=13288 RepID=A0AAU9RPS2_THLAR|nr:unnamed protein product [Thlaspi arvense]